MALSPAMQHLDALSLGVFSYLHAHRRVARLEPRELVGASHVQLAIWEQVRVRSTSINDRLHDSANGLKHSAHGRHTEALPMPLA